MNAPLLSPLEADELARIATDLTERGTVALHGTRISLIRKGYLEYGAEDSPYVYGLTALGRAAVARKK